VLATRGRHWGRPRFLLIALVAIFAVALPASASASTFTVNSVGDQPDETIDGTCKASVNVCTLRAAIQESNATEAEDKILFSPLFNGLSSSVIAPATALPPITESLEIISGTCPTSAGVLGPCTEVRGPNTASVLKVESDAVSIFGLAITGGEFGVNVVNASSEFVLRSSWVGIKLDGLAGSNSKAGVFIAPESTQAVIGGGEASQRNLIAFNPIGLEIVGADSIDIQGNWFGLEPDGTVASGVGENIEVADSTGGPGFKAENIRIGASLAEGPAESPDCDGVCNVISGASSVGIDLNGDGAIQEEAPASGPITVQGNYIGLNPAGTEVAHNGTYGVFIGAADDVLVGGQPGSDTNRIAGGSYGVYEENGDEDRVAANVIGEDVEGDAVSPDQRGIVTSGEKTTEAPVIRGNTIRMAGSGQGIENRFLGAEIVDNEVVDAFTGINLIGNTEGTGNLVEGNVVRNPTANAALNIDNADNEVYANEFDGSSTSTVWLKKGATGNRIGGDTPASENFFTNSAYSPIAIVTYEETQNEVARNWGENNGLVDGEFISIGKAEGSDPNNPNGGIEPPTVATPLQSSAAGSGEPGARLRVFRQATSGSADLESFLGEAVADGSGNWKATYAGQVPTGTAIAVSQTNADGGTSELAYAISAADPPGPPKEKEPEACLATSGNCGGGPGSTLNVPDTKIAKNPKLTGKPTAKFKFTSSISGSSFECKLDKKKFAKCRSPKTYKKLKPGKHVFKVRAVSPAGIKDTSPAIKKFTVKG
jgi:CSLREA domain-containing protein